MGKPSIISEYNLDLFVKDVLVYENTAPDTNASLSFFADGYPGIIFLQSENRAILQPNSKELSTFFLYGQTLEPIEIFLKGTYRMIVFQLYPFVSKLLFGIDPKTLNDDCYDLTTIRPEPLSGISSIVGAASQTNLIAKFLSDHSRGKVLETYSEIQRAFDIIIHCKGMITVKKLAEMMGLSERTLQRKFKGHIGISPKKMAQIVQFQSSLDQLSKNEPTKLTDIVYENGYADQSHFIRNIRKFTGLRPTQLKNLL